MRKQILLIVVPVCVSCSPRESRSRPPVAVSTRIADSTTPMRSGRPPLPRFRCIPLPTSRFAPRSRRRWTRPGSARAGDRGVRRLVIAEENRELRLRPKPRPQPPAAEAEAEAAACAAAAASARQVAVRPFDVVGRRDSRVHQAAREWWRLRRVQQPGIRCCLCVPVHAGHLELPRRLDRSFRSRRCLSGSSLTGRPGHDGRCPSRAAGPRPLGRLLRLATST